jgi:xylulokinase
MHGMVPLDGSDRPVRPALLWNDQRTADETAALEAAVGRERLIARTGNPGITGFQLPKVLWLRRHEPDRFALVRRVMLPKDFVGLTLTGEAVVGTLRPGVAEAAGLGQGTPVVAGAGDNAAAATALALGRSRPDVGSVSLGTSGVLVAPLAEPTPDPQGRVHLFAHADGGYLLMGVTLSAGGSLRWFRDVFAAERSYDELMTLAARSPAGSRGVTFKPYLAGERTPHLEPDLRGSFHGLSLATDLGDVVRAVLEGVACSLRDALDVMRPLAAPARWLATGGGAASDLWLRIVADALEAPVVRLLAEVGAAEGAAWLAWRAVGHAPDRAPPEGDALLPTEDGVDAMRAVHERYVGRSG